MSNTIVIAIIVAVVIIVSTSIIAILVWAERTKSILVKFAILTPIYVGIVLSTITDIVDDFNSHRIVSAVLGLIGLLVVLITMIFVSLVNPEKLKDFISKFKEK